MSVFWITLLFVKKMMRNQKKVLERAQSKATYSLEWEKILAAWTDLLRMQASEVFYTKCKSVLTSAEFVRKESSVMEKWSPASNMVKANGWITYSCILRELYTALQQRNRKIAAEIILRVCITSKHYEVCKFLIVGNEHAPLPDVVIVSTKVGKSIDSTRSQQWLQRGGR